VFVPWQMARAAAPERPDCVLEQAAAGRGQSAEALLDHLLPGGLPPVFAARLGLT